MATRRKRAETGSTADAAGVSAAAVRDFLLQSAETPNWSTAQLQKILAVEPAVARGVLAALKAAGYIEQDPRNLQRWHNTEAGNSMAGVSRARPIKRKTADKALAELLDRIREVNLETEFAYRVQRAVVFGPYLPGAENITNIDVAVELMPKIKDARKLAQRVEADADRAASAGKRFKSFADRRAWGATKVKQYLKGRGRAIALYDLDEKVLNQPHKVVYTD